MVLLTTVCKLLTSIVAYRLTKMAEKTNLYDPHQEGFRHQRSKAWQAQALGWDQDDALTRRMAFYTAYIVFQFDGPRSALVLDDSAGLSYRRC